MMEVRVRCAYIVHIYAVVRNHEPRSGERSVSAPFVYGSKFCRLAVGQITGVAGSERET